MKTEELQIEYGIFYTIFKDRLDAIKKLKEYGVKSDYFCNVYHRKLYDKLCKIIQENPDISFKGLKTYYLSLSDTTSEDKLHFKSVLTESNNNKISTPDLLTHTKLLKEYYVSRKFLKDVSMLIDSQDSIKQSLNLITENINSYKNILDDSIDTSILTLKGDMDKRIEYVSDVKNDPNKLGLIETGLINIDKYIGKQHRGAYVIYEARTGVGKSMMLMGTAVHNFKKGRNVIVITIEMSAFDYLFRIDSHLTKFKHSDFSMGNIVEDEDKMSKWKRTIKKIGKNSENDLIVYWVPENCTPDKVYSIIANNPFKPDLVIVDYVGDMSANLKGIDNLDPRAQGYCSSRLKAMAGEFECVIYTGQQTKRGVKKIDTESGANTDIANRKADILIGIMCTKDDEAFITEHEGQYIYGRLTLFIAKGRNIPKCRTHIIPNFTRMSWIEKENEEIDLVDGGVSKTDKTRQTEAKEEAEKADDEDFDDTPMMLD